MTKPNNHKTKALHLERRERGKIEGKSAVYSHARHCEEYFSTTRQSRFNKVTDL